MATEENTAMARRLYDTFNEAFRTGDLSLLGEVLTPDTIDHNPSPGQGPGLEGVKQVFMAFLAAFPDFQLTVEDMIADGDKVASRLTVRATHRGDFLGIPATGKRVTQTGIDILRIAGGKVVERWGEFDNLGLMQQLGVVPPPGQGGS